MLEQLWRQGAPFESQQLFGAMQGSLFGAVEPQPKEKEKTSSRGLTHVGEGWHDQAAEAVAKRAQQCDDRAVTTQVASVALRLLSQPKWRQWHFDWNHLSASKELAWSCGLFCT